MSVRASRPSLSSLPHKSSCRKRSHDQISRSQSPSTSPWHLPRTTVRTSGTPFSPLLGLNSSPSRTPPARFAGDGLDFRRPTMATDNSNHSPSSSSSPSSSMSPSPEPHLPVIDLTSETESPPSLFEHLSNSRSSLRGSHRNRSRPDERLRPGLEPPAEGRSRTTTGPPVHNGRAPRFGRNIMSGTPELIDLSNVSDDAELVEEIPPYNRRLPLPVPSMPVESSTGSSDVEFVSSRPISQPAAPQPRAAPSTYPFQGFVRGMSNLRDLIVHTPNFLGAGPPAAATIGSRAGQADRAFQEEMRRITSGINGPYRARPTVSTNAGARPLHVPVMAEDFDALAFDYTQSAFAVGDFLEPEAGSSTPDRRPSPPYKPPPNAMKGFTRKVDEEDVVVCVNCGNELGAGDEEVTKQVWVAKQCGHGYCGQCATNRTITRGGNKKDARRITQRKTEPFKTCKADHCGRPVSHKNSMIQIYL